MTIYFFRFYNRFSGIFRPRINPADIYKIIYKCRIFFLRIIFLKKSCLFIFLNKSGFSLFVSKEIRFFRLNKLISKPRMNVETLKTDFFFITNICSIPFSRIIKSNPTQLLYLFQKLSHYICFYLWFYFLNVLTNLLHLFIFSIMSFSCHII